MSSFPASGCQTWEKWRVGVITGVGVTVGASGVGVAVASVGVRETVGGGVRVIVAVGVLVGAGGCVGRRVGVGRGRVGVGVLVGGKVADGVAVAVSTGVIDGVLLDSPAGVVLAACASLVGLSPGVGVKPKKTSREVTPRVQPMLSTRYARIQFRSTVRLSVSMWPITG